MPGSMLRCLTGIQQRQQFMGIARGSISLVSKLRSAPWPQPLPETAEDAIPIST